MNIYDIHGKVDNYHKRLTGDEGEGDHFVSWTQRKPVHFTVTPKV